MKTGMTVLAVSFLTAGGLFAQVHIRESATISPVENRKMIRSYVHSLSLELQLSVPAYVMVTLGEQRCQGNVLQFIDTTVYSNEKVASFSFGFSTVGQYYIGAYLNVTDGLPAGSFKWSVSGDGLPVKSDSGFFPEQPRHTTGVFHLPLISSGLFAASYYSTFKISVGTSGGGAGWPLLQGGSASIQSTGVVDCSENIWSPESDSLMLRIVYGSRYASFHRVDALTGADDSLGEIVATVGDSVGMIRLDADGEEPDSAGDWVVIEAQSKGLSDRDSILLEPFYLVHFKAYYPSTIQSAGGFNVWLEALDREGRNVMIPDSVRISISPDSVSRRYGSLIAGDTTGKELTGIPWSALSYGSFTYVADGEDPPGPVDIHIEITLPGQDVRPTDMVFRLLPQPAIVTVTPPSMMPGDTASITVQQRNEDGTLTDFAADKQFEIGIFRGEDYGVILLADGIKGGYFSNVTQPFRFIAAGEIAGDSVRVGIRVGTEEPELGSAAPGGKGAGETAQKFAVEAAEKRDITHAGKVTISRGSETAADVNSFYWSDFGIGWVKISNEVGHIILLGQEIYYYAIPDPDNSSKLIIQETKMRPLQLGAGGLSDAQFHDPVAAPGSQKDPVYSEHKDNSGKKLPDGMIRLVGRYWEQGKTFKATLTAHTPDGKSGSIDIEVKRPARLGNGPQIVEDVFGDNVNIDSLIIKCAGENGISPQIIKGQIDHESSFEPAYRYEPNQDLDYQSSPSARQRYFGTGNNFVVTADIMGSGPAIPGTHSYVPPLGNYIKSPVTVRDYLAGNPWHYVNTSRLIFFNDATITSHWRGYFTQLRENRPRLSRQSLITQSLAVTMNAFRQGLFGRTEYNQIAQTRIMASYGFLQLTHYNATDLNLYGFTKTSTSQPPELLNDQSYNFPAYAARMLIKLNLVIGRGLPQSNWANGYEKTWLEVLKTYNPGEKNYGIDVLSNSRNYLPTSGE